MKLQLNPDWTEFLSLLISKRVRFVLVGGHAVAAHGEPRLTEDLDVFVDRALANAVRLREALVAFGFGSAIPSARKLAVPGRIWMIGRKDLIANKRASGRDKDLRDVAMLEALSSTPAPRARGRRRVTRPHCDE